MLKLEKIKEVKFNYYDENEYIYNFKMLEDRTEKISNDEYRFYLVCENTNVSANGEVFVNIKLQDNNLSFRTDYFANSFDYISLEKNEENSKELNDTFTVSFGQDIFELKLFY